MEYRCKNNYNINIWFPVPMMFGGFSFSLTCKDGAYELIADSWSRVCDAGQTHKNTKSKTELIQERFP